MVCDLGEQELLMDDLVMVSGSSLLFLESTAEYEYKQEKERLKEW